MLIRTRDIDFLLHEWLGLDEILARPRFAEHSRETVDAIIELGDRMASDVFLPHYKESDRDEPRLTADGVKVLPAIGRAIEEYARAGLFGTAFDEPIGGSQLPHTVHLASLAQFMAANISTTAYVMLTVANARLIAKYGNARQIEAFAKPQVAGRVLGTMCLSEPQAGSGLGDIKTRAVADGQDAYGQRFRLYGNKMWISGGDQDITDNIVHLVLAKVPHDDGRLVEGTKGISLFIVPKLLERDGSEDTVRNDVVVAGLNHKMGYRGTANCLLNLGEGKFQPDGQAGAVGYLIGEAGQGLSIMFHMMNEARIDVGLGAAALAYRGYLLSVQYANDRRQGRAAGVEGQAPLISHPDVKSMLLAQKAYAEGGLALVLYCARLIDDEMTCPEVEKARQASELLDLLTPVAKTWPSEWGLAANDLAIQIHGGYGYTRDFDVEQLYRDNRLNPIHEGTTGIQGLDLLGRKILKDRARAFGILHGMVAATAAQAARAEDSKVRSCAETLIAEWDHLEQTIGRLTAVQEQGKALDNSTSFLRAFGHGVVAWIWLEQALVATRALKSCDDAFYRGKLRACAYFFDFELPKIAAWLSPVDAHSEVSVAACPDEF